MPYPSGTVVTQPNQFKYLRKFFKAILEEHEIDSTYYDEAISDVNVHLWQKAMKAKLEYMYSNKV